MRIFLLWDRTTRWGREVSPEIAAAALQRLFAPLLKSELELTIRQTESANLVFLQQKVPNWKLPFFEEDDRGWTLAIDYPLGGPRSLLNNGNGKGNLLPLCKALQDRPAELLREMSPPYSLIWHDKKSGQTFAQTDGLGLAQLFVFRENDSWALTNKLFALKTVNITLSPKPEEWAVRATLGWFPMTMTGYKDVEYVKPGTQYRVCGTGLEAATHDVLADWVRPQKLPRKDCAEVARRSIVKYLEATMPLCERPFVGLTGGWDSRAVISTLRLLRCNFQARVKGNGAHPDVLIARQLASIANIDLKIRTSAEVPSEDVADWKRSIRLALLWQAGYREAEFHKTFLTHGKYLGAGHVSIMGKHGEIGRGYYYPGLGSAEVDDKKIEKSLVKQLLKRTPPFIKPCFRDFISETIRKAYRQANVYGLSGLAGLDFFYLFERTRRNSAGSLNAHTGLIVAPFMNPDYIRAAFGYVGLEKADNMFPRYIIATNAPDWAETLHSRELKAHPVVKQQPKLPSSAAEAHLRRFGKSRYYDNLRCWRAVGEPMIMEAFKEGGFWQEVFDPDATKREWIAAPDELSMTHLLQSVL